MAGHAQDHDFYIPANNIWPPLSCLGAGIMAFAFIFWIPMQNALLGQTTMLVGTILTVFSAFQWFRGLVQESRARGFKKVPLVLDLANRYGMIFFIVSEVMFFAAFFAAYFYLTNFNSVWPPANIETLGIELPLINTLLLLTSGVTVTWAHHALIEGNKKTATFFTMLTWHLGVIFLFCQMFEYGHAAFGFDSGIYGSTFYMLTGFHGFHVLVGSVMLMIAHLRLRNGDFTAKEHFYFEATAWYWHFVDVVWIGLFLFVYVLAS